MTIIVQDLEINTELDKEAMISILGGWKNQVNSTTTFYSNLATPSKIRWSNIGPHVTQYYPTSRSRTKIYKY